MHCHRAVVDVVDGTTILLGVIAIKGARVHLHRAFGIPDGTALPLGVIAVKGARVHLRHRGPPSCDGTTPPFLSAIADKGARVHLHRGVIGDGTTPLGAIAVKGARVHL